MHLRLKSNQWSFSQRTPVIWWARGHCGIIFPWLARGRASVPLNPSSQARTPPPFIIGEPVPSRVSRYLIFWSERSVCVSFEPRAVGVVHVLTIVPFWLIPARIDWYERGWCSTKESFEKNFVEGGIRTRKTEREKEKKIGTAGTETNTIQVRYKG